MPPKYVYKTEDRVVCETSSKQCIDNAKNGSRCRNRVIIGVPWCWIHLKKRGYRIKASTIPNSGKGVFTLNTLDPNRNIMNYDGDVIDTEEIDRRYGNNTAPYAVEKRVGLYIDSICNRSPASMINHKRGRGANCKFSRYMGLMRVRTTKRIPADSELFINYGQDYSFRDLSPVRLTKVRSP